MPTYIAKRLLLVIPTLIGIQTIMFFISEFVPGGPLDQLYAKLRGETQAVLGQGQGEIARRREGDDSDRKQIDPREELRLKRALGLNRNRFERYLRTLLWYSPDSFISSREIDHRQSAKAFIGDRPVIVYRDDDTEPRFFVYENRFATIVTSRRVETGPDGQPVEREVKERATGEVVLDPEKHAFRSVLDNTILFDLHTGARIDGPGSLAPVPISVRRERFTDYRLTRDGARERYRETREEIYLRESAIQALFNWDNWHGFFLLKFPVSEAYNKRCLALIRERLPVSMRLGIISFFLTYVGCITLGIAKAVKHGSAFDVVTSVIVLLGYSIPGFVLAVFMIKMFGPGDASFIHLIPLKGIHSESEVYAAMGFWMKLWDNIHHMIAPILCLTIGSFAGLTLLTKNSILEQFHQLYAVAARARGLSERQVLFKHILRNSLIPLVTGFPARFLMMFLGGSLLIEKIFSLNGLGLLGYTAVQVRDFPLIMSNLFIFTLIGLICRILTDICYVVVDPRISFEESRA